MNGAVNPPRATIQSEAGRRFAEVFGRPPGHAGVAPGRVNLIGDHTDYNGGLVLPMAINAWCVAVGAPNGLGKHRLAPETGEVVHKVLNAGVTPADRGQWWTYVLGVLVESGWKAGGLDIAVASSVPMGAGLSSSAALELSVAMLLRAMGLKQSDEAMVDACVRAERVHAGVPCGVMDQTISMFARAGHAMLLDCRDGSQRHAPMPQDAAVMVIDSGVRHALSDGGYAQRRACCERAAKVLGVAVLREATSEMVERAPGLDEQERACARHVVSENQRVAAAYEALLRGDCETFGRLMLASHASLRDDFRVSVPEVDAIVERAMAVEGVYGARITGGGFGGSVVALLPRKHVEPLAAAMRILPGTCVRVFEAGGGAMARPSDAARA